MRWYPLPELHLFLCEQINKSINCKLYVAYHWVNSRNPSRKNRHRPKEITTCTHIMLCWIRTSIGTTVYNVLFLFWHNQWLQKGCYSVKWWDPTNYHSCSMLRWLTHGCFGEQLSRLSILCSWCVDKAESHVTDNTTKRNCSIWIT